ncbi:MAG: trigger factor [Lachnospiraceae bacterium]|nr:trigger factor [Lachnospiraceae bacterium]
MSATVENLEKSMVKLTIEVDVKDFNDAIKKVYNKQKGKIAVPGFRKGKAPLAMALQYYGREAFFEDAANEVMPDAYAKAIEENNVQAVSRPEIDLVQMIEDKPFIFSATVAVRPEVTLGEYKGVEVTKREATVTDEELNAELDKNREKQARFVPVEDRAVEANDEVTIDFEGFVDGEAFPGGKGENYKLVIGSHSFIDNFEDQLIGKNIGEDVEVNVTFPEQYQEPSLAGKPALFKVKINGISYKELPELDDDFAQDVSNFDTFDEYKEDVKSKLLESKVDANKRETEEEALEKVIENATMEVADLHVRDVKDQMVQDIQRNMMQQGINLEQYLMFTGTTPEKFNEDMEAQALKRIQSRLVLEEIVKVENIEASEEDVNEEIANIAKMYGMEADKLKETMTDADVDSITLDMKVKKASELIVESVVEK